VISARGLVPPLVLPAAVAAGGADLDTLVTVSPTAVGLGVDVATAAGVLQEPVASPPVPLETIVAPNPGMVGFVPAGAVLMPGGDPVPGGALTRDAWALKGDVSFLRGLIPVTVPVPVLWLLEGVDAATVGSVLDDWLAGLVPGVVPQTLVCHGSADPAEQGATPADTYRTRMLAGTWREWLPEAEALLGLAGADADGTGPGLTVRAFDENDAEIPVAAVLEIMAVVDPEFLAAHPVVRQAGDVAADLPVRMHLRLDVWDVDLASVADPKGSARALAPLEVHLVADDAGGPVTGATQRWIDPYTLVEITRSAVEGRAFHIEIDLSPDTAIRREHGRDRFWPDEGQEATWSLAGWTAADGVTPGGWAAFSGIQVGTATDPATFWVGTKVRLVIQYEQQQRDYQGGKPVPSLRLVYPRRVAPGHVVGLHPGLDPFHDQFYDEFFTDGDGEVSGVSFGVPAGGPLGVAVGRGLLLPPDPALGTLQGVELRAEDQPDHLYTGNVGTRRYLFAGDGGYFWSQHAAAPVFFDSVTSPFTSADLTVTVRVDADKSDDAKGNTPYAAALHALRFGWLTHEALTVLKGDDAGLPQQHDFHLVIQARGLSSTGSYDRDLVGPRVTRTTLYAGSSWFTNGDVIHEYGHAIVQWLSDRLLDQTRRTIYETAIGLMNDQFLTEWGPPLFHSYPVVTNAGIALAEGLPPFLQRFLTEANTLPSGTAPLPPGQETWGRFLFDVHERGPGATLGLRRSLGERCGRRVEGVFAEAVYTHVSGSTGLTALFDRATDTEFGGRSPRGYLDDWLAGFPVPDRPARLAELRRLVDLVWVDPVRTVVGNDALWNGEWNGNFYPKVKDVLDRIAAHDPAGFRAFHDTVLVPWNLEQIDPNEPVPPVVGPDWLP
jgi:hypothetical protein